MSDDEVVRAVVCMTGRMWFRRHPERRWYFHRQKYANDIRRAPAKHLTLVTVPA